MTDDRAREVLAHLVELDEQTGRCGIMTELTSKQAVRAMQSYAAERVAEALREAAGVKKALFDLCFAAGALNIATDGKSEYRAERENVLSALRVAQDALIPDATKGEG